MKRHQLVSDEPPAAVQQSRSVRDRIEVSLDNQALSAIELLVEAGIHATRDEAATWLIMAGLAANRDMLTRMTAKVEEARRPQAKTYTRRAGDEKPWDEGEPPG